MALTHSRMLDLGTPLPHFTLRDVVSNTLITPSTQHGVSAYLLAVICNHCPYVIHIRTAFVAFARKAQQKGVAVFALSANDASRYPEDGPEKMRELAHNQGFSFPYLYDEQQEVVKMLQAVCTPEFYLFDAAQKLVYRGQMDDSRPGNNAENNAYCLDEALETMLNGREVSPQQIPSAGCSIKWKPDSTT